MCKIKTNIIMDNSLFSSADILYLVNKMSPLYTIRFNKNGNISIEPSSITAPYVRTKYTLTRHGNLYSIRVGKITDTRQKKTWLVKFKGQTKVSFNEVVDYMFCKTYKSKYIG